MLPPFAEPGRKTNRALLELGRPGGLLDANDDLAAGPVLLITDPSLSLNNPNNSQDTAGVTFVGQFMDHDLTFDLTSRLGRPAKPRNSPNGRTPAFDLDSVYGGGP
ncbi:MAG: peroxidase, partial [Geminicoccaceae bacterium]